MHEFRYASLTQPNQFRILTLHPGNGNNLLEGSIDHVRLRDPQTRATQSSEQDEQSENIFQLPRNNALTHSPAWSSAYNLASTSPFVSNPSRVWPWNIVRTGSKEGNGRWQNKSQRTVKCVCDRREYDAIEYDALSYAWGDPITTTVIMINEKRPGIARNLYLALIQFRSSTTSRRLWIDAICIDQGNVQERNHQVQLMKKVYSAASSVIAWLGDLSKDLKPVVNMIVDFNDRSQVKNIILDYEEAEIRGLRNFFSQPWWKRIWIIQEIVAAREVVVFVGDIVFPWCFLESVCREIYSTELTPHPWASLLRCCGCQVFTTLQNFRHSPNKSLVHLLHCTQDYEASDPRDKLYALLGLAADVSACDIVPDYSKPTRKIFEDLVQFMVEGRRSLDVISLGRSCNSTFGSPSWLPRWDSATGWQPWPRRHTDHGFPSACNNTEARVDLSQFPRALIAEGVFVDMVDFYVNSFIMAHEHLQTTQRWAYIARQVVDHETMKHFPQIIVAAKEGKDVDSSTNIEQALTTFMSYSGWMDLKTSQNFLYSVTKATTGRRFFVTKRGKIALGPIDIRPRDKIVILNGCHVPQAIRAVGKSWVLVGEVYVPGIMDGEIMRELAHGRYETRMIRLS